MKYKAVLFDLDGTLLDTLEDLATSVNRGLADLGFPQHPVRDYKYFVGWGREEMAARALPEDKRDPATIDRLVEIINREYSQHWADHTRPYDGVPELLDALTARKIKMAILSNKPHDFTELMVTRLLSRWHFEIVAGALSSMPKKPDCTVAFKYLSTVKYGPALNFSIWATRISICRRPSTPACSRSGLCGDSVPLLNSGWRSQNLINHPLNSSNFVA